MDILYNKRGLCVCVEQKKYSSGVLKYYITDLKTTKSGISLRCKFYPQKEYYPQNDEYYVTDGVMTLTVDGPASPVEVKLKRKDWLTVINVLNYNEFKYLYDDIKRTYRMCQNFNEWNNSIGAVENVKNILAKEKPEFFLLAELGID